MTMWTSPSQLYLAIEAVDMRVGIDGLSQRVQQSLGKAPCDGTLAYCFKKMSTFPSLTKSAESAYSA